MNEYSKDGEKYCIILSNEKFEGRNNLSNRTGTKVDLQNLLKLFKSDLKFKVDNKIDLTAAEMERVLEEYSKNPLLANASMLVVIILSHGDDDIIYGVDGHSLRVSKLFNRFKGDQCGYLLGKPKLFFIQACRGDKYDPGVQKHDAVGINYEMPKIPIESDVLYGYSTVPGYFSWRNNANGSWYIQALVDVFKKHAKEEDVVHMLVRVNSTVSSCFASNTGDKATHGMLQTPSFLCMLRKKVFLI